MAKIGGAAEWLPLGILLAALLSVNSCANVCSNEVSVSIGEFDSEEVGSRASIQRLSSEIRRCPGGKKFKISWTWKVAPGEQERGWRATMYERDDGGAGRVGYEYDPDSGFRGDVYNVRDDAIHSVAGRAGTLEDVAKYHRAAN